MLYRTCPWTKNRQAMNQTKHVFIHIFSNNDCTDSVSFCLKTSRLLSFCLLSLIAYYETLKLSCNYHNKHHTHILIYHSPFHQHRQNGRSPIVFWQNGFLHGHSAVVNKTSYGSLRQGSLNNKKQL
jgi:hypothetical protein